MSFLSTLFGTKNKASEKIAVLDTATYSNAITGKKVQLVDVRSTGEFHSGHIKNAINIDFFDTSNFQKSFGKLDKDQPVYVYCRSGARSYKAAKRLVSMGFSKIYDLKGGYMSWK